MGSEYIHVVLNLAAVMLLMIGLGYFIKKFKLTKFASNKHIKIMNMVSIGAKEKVILMEVNNTFLLVGATPNHIETLYVFSDLEAPKATPQEDAVQKTTFSERMRSLTS